MATRLAALGVTTTAPPPASESHAAEVETAEAAEVAEVEASDENLDVASLEQYLLAECRRNLEIEKDQTRPADWDGA